MTTYTLNEQNTTLLPEFQQYSDKFGLVTDSSEQIPSGNGILYTAHMIAGLCIKSKMTEAERLRIFYALNACMKEPGLLRRSLAKMDDYESWDDYVGILGADVFLNPENRTFTRQILEYGKNTFCSECDVEDPSRAGASTTVYNILSKLMPGKINFVYNTKNPGKFDADSWHGRRIDLIATMDMALKNNISTYRWLYWAGSMLSILLAKPDNHDAYILKYHMVNAVTGYGPLSDWVCKIVLNKIKKDHGDMGSLLAKHFNNPEHPLVALLKGVC